MQQSSGALANAWQAQGGGEAFLSEESAACRPQWRGASLPDTGAST